MKSHREWKEEQSSPFDKDDNYKYGNYKSVDEDFLGNPVLECLLCGLKHKTRMGDLMRRKPIRCKCGNK